MITENQKTKIIELGDNKLGESYVKGYKCHDFIRTIFHEVGMSTNFFDYQMLPYEEIWKEEAVGGLLFLHRKETKISKKITHIGIILPGHKLLHYSRWMGTERIFKVLCSSFEEVFSVYDFVEPQPLTE
jgi:hypothetical protein